MVKCFTSKNPTQSALCDAFEIENQCCNFYVSKPEKIVQHWSFDPENFTPVLTHIFFFFIESNKIVVVGLTFQ
jgi:hypothetical protein